MEENNQTINLNNNEGKNNKQKKRYIPKPFSPQLSENDQIDRFFTEDDR